MKTDKLIAEASISIDASAAATWKAITTPALIKKYLMGTQVTSDWKVGSPITYQGEYNGKAYHDKGMIKKIEPEKIFQSTYWSSVGGKEDKPENYNLVTLTQDNVLSEKEKEHVTENWKGVLKKLKEVVENK